VTRSCWQWVCLISTTSYSQFHHPSGLLNCIRALGGYTLSHSAETVFDTDAFKEGEYLTHIHSTSGNLLLALNWCVYYFRQLRTTEIQFLRYNSFKVTFFLHNIPTMRLIQFVQVVGLFCVGYFEEAAALGQSIYQTRDRHPKWVINSLCAVIDHDIIDMPPAIVMSATPCFSTIFL
jgi:hypothetical protein